MSAVGETSALVVPLRDALDPARFGGKAAGLARLLRAGLPVPAGVVLPAGSWPDDRRLEPDERAALNAALAPHLAASPANSRAGPERFAVRSSAVGEDGETSAAAGIFRTCLDCGRDALLDAIEAVLASLDAAPARAWRARTGAARGGMAVIVQRFIEPELAGVVFTPDNRLRPEAESGMVIELVRGRGAALVDGRARPERWFAPVETGRPGAPCGVPVCLDGPPEDATPEDSTPGERRRVLAALLELTEQASRVGDGPPRPLDIEWASVGETVWLLQARPVTRALPIAATAGPGESGELRVWTAANAREALPNPVTALTWSFFEPLITAGLAGALRTCGLEPPEEPGPVRLIEGRPYFNPGWFRALLAKVPGAPTNIFDALIFGEGLPTVRFAWWRFRPISLRLGWLLLTMTLTAPRRLADFAAGFPFRLEALSGDLSGGPAGLGLTELSDAALRDRRAALTALLAEAFDRHVEGTALAGSSYLLLDLFLRHHGLEERHGPGVAARLTAGLPDNVLFRLEAERRALLRLSPGPEREAAIQGWLARWGHRCEEEAELAAPRPVEDPRGFALTLESPLESGREGPAEVADVADVEAALAALRAEAERLRRLIREELAGHPLRRWIFGFLRSRACRFASARENFKDRGLKVLLELRRLFLESGRRLVERGVLSEPEQVFELTLAELDRALAGERVRDGDGDGSRDDASQDDPSWSERCQRRARLRAERAAAPAPPAMIERGAGFEPVRRAPSASSVLAGVGVSAGVARGPARVLTALSQADRLRPGEILVAPYLNAAWTPLYDRAAGLVADMGGLLSHGAIVAREAGLPAVFGATDASERIQDGERLIVDGSRGLVLRDGGSEPDPLGET